jgi:hypothetical protein
MYRTATMAVYDVLDQVHVSVKVMTYPSTPGTVPPDVEVFAAQVSSKGHDDTTLWLWEALQALQAVLDHQ